MSLWTSAEVATATGGRATREWQANGVSIDTRTLRDGDLFVALRDVRDGHDFVAQALQKGAAAALVSHVPEGVPPDAPLLIVDDVLRALEDLGRAARARTRAQVVAVTGSVGKTSTKEMLRDVLRGQGATHAAEASYNNHWGVPLTLARMPVETQFSVIEIGMNHPGEIAPLAAMARPHVAIITTVAPAHLEAFENIEGIAREKASILTGLKKGGTAILNGDVDTAQILRDTARGVAARIVTFGESAACDMRLLRVDLHDRATVAHAADAQGPFVYKVGSAGRHFARNALAVIAAADAMGADRAVILSDLGRWQPPAGRGTRQTLHLDIADEALTIDLIDDAFNANPASMAASLDVLAAATPRDGIGRVTAGRRIAVLGEMLELGPDEEALHAALAELPAMAALTRVHCVGPRMRALFEALPLDKRGLYSDTAETLAAEAHRLIDAGDIVLVKGSKGSKVSLVVEALLRAARWAPRVEGED